MRKLTSMFSRRRDPDLGCGFLSQREVDSLVEGHLAGDRQARFGQHLLEGCAECLHLSEAVQEFRRILEQGPLQAEKAAFERGRRAILARLREEARRAAEEDGTVVQFPWARGMSTAELEQIAAAGEASSVAGPSAGENVVFPEDPGGGDGIGPEKKSPGDAVDGGDDPNHLDRG
jgi:hypothetical protein